MKKMVLFFVNGLGIIILLSALEGCSGIFSDGQSNTQDIILEPERLDPSIISHLESDVNQMLSDSGKLNDTVILKEPQWVGKFYESNEYTPIWSTNGVFYPLADSMISFIKEATYFGLVPSTYHVDILQKTHQSLKYDSVVMKDAVQWSKMDLLLTDAFFHITRHVKHGRLPIDSLTMRSDSVLHFAYADSLLKEVNHGASLKQAFASVEPTHKGYQLLKRGLKQFLDSVGSFPMSHLITYPYIDTNQFKQQLIVRLQEEKLLIDSGNLLSDTLSIRKAIFKYQQSIGLKATGKINAKTILRLNENSWDKFLSIAINMDRYKMLPDTMPHRYVWVNIPAYSLQVWEADTIAMSSKVIVGKPDTRTPKLTSKIANILTYPQWTIPTSIIAKEILPAAQKDPGYFKRKGYMVVGAKGKVMDPYSVNWSKYKKNIPYQIVQGSGDDNALGILKFNFNNRFSVYMHDTNQRYLFQQAERSMSHGCVRVESWSKLAQYLLRVDSASTNRFYEGDYPPVDSLSRWLKRKEKHYLYLKNRVPLFIRYFTCEGKNDQVKFYHDIYKEDSVLKMTIFKNNKIAAN